MIYLDNAATSYPKPASVYEAMDRFARTQCGNPGRSGHKMAVESQRIVSTCRRAVAELLGAAAPERVAFALNATDAINIALKGILKPGDHVVSTSIEHNAVARPLNKLRQDGVPVTFVGASPEGVVSVDAILENLLPATRMVVMTHASNVVGAIQPIEKVAEILRGSSTLLLVDAAQTAGVVPIHVERMGIDLLAFAGHKGPLGPTGTGGLVLGSRADPAPLREGGTGTKSESPEHPNELPERLEAGTVNCIGLAGLLEGVRYIQERTVEDILQHEREMGQALYEGLSLIPRVTLYGPNNFEERVGVVSFNILDADSRDVAAVLDTSFDIAVRPGVHCAPLAHQTLGTFPGGSVRMSSGVFTTMDEVQAAVGAVAAIAESM